MNNLSVDTRLKIAETVKGYVQINNDLHEIAQTATVEQLHIIHRAMLKNLQYMDELLKLARS